MAGASDWLGRPLLLGIDKSPLHMVATGFPDSAMLYRVSLSSRAEFDWAMVVFLGLSDRHLRTACCP
jgi:hypothetical protein